MVKTVRFDKTGGAEVLQIFDIPLEEPRDGYVTVRHTAIEVNFFDILQRRGSMSLPHSQNILGMSAVGYVEKITEGVTTIAIGDKVCYFYPKFGAYAEKCNIPAEYLIKIESSTLEDFTIAGSIVKILTAHFLCLRVHILNDKKVVLVHSAAGGVGQVVAKFASVFGAFVIGTVGSEEKKQAALDAGCNIVYNRATDDWVKEVRSITNGYGVAVAYDSIGKDTINSTLDAMADIGVVIHYGATSGEISTIDAVKIRDKSLFYTRPLIFPYKAERYEYILSMNEVLRVLEQGIVIPTVTQFKLDQVADAHTFLESGKSIGSMVLIP